MSSESWTKTTESGAFIRVIHRKGKKRKQRTKRFKKNAEKVVLAYIGDFEVYVYPFNYPDTVFIGAFPVSTQINKVNAGELLSAYNKVRWFLDGEAFSKPKKAKAANARRRAISSAYNEGLSKLKKPKISR